MSSFDIAYKFVKVNEGGYVNDPNDAGGETNHGISKRSYPNLDIKNLTASEAKEIYKRDYWNAFNLSAIRSQAIATTIFDFIVNSGGYGATRIIQRVLNESFGARLSVDGALGKLTLAEINKADPSRLLVAINDARLAFMKSLPSWKSFGNGWTKRIVANLELLGNNEKNSILYAGLGILGLVIISKNT